MGSPGAGPHLARRHFILGALRTESFEVGLKENRIQGHELQPILFARAQFRIGVFLGSMS